MIFLELIVIEFFVISEFIYVIHHCYYTIKSVPAAITVFLLNIREISVLNEVSINDIVRDSHDSNVGFSYNKVVSSNVIILNLNLYTFSRYLNNCRFS